MPDNKRTRPTASVAPPKPPLLVPHPPSAPLLPPAHVVDLMTVEGSAVFDAQWKAMEAKIVECPALADAMPEFRTTYDIEPYAGVSGFDDSAWPVIAADDSSIELAPVSKRLTSAIHHAANASATNATSADAMIAAIAYGGAQSASAPASPASSCAMLTISCVCPWPFQRST